MKAFCNLCPSRGRLNPIIRNGAEFKCDLRVEDSICNILDMRLLELLQKDHPGKVFDYNYLQKLSFINEVNGIVLQKKISNSFYKKPKTFKAFLMIMYRLHFGIFKDIPLKYVGKFREEPVWFDINANQIEGVEFKMIIPSLYGLWDNILKQYLLKDHLSKADLILVSSSFLSHFFRIHPYLDGNGRVARNFIKIIMFHYGYEIYFTPLDKTQARYTRRYVKALRFSHKNFYRKYKLDDFVSSHELKRINKLLILFFDNLVFERLQDSQVEVEPHKVQGRFSKIILFLRKFID